MYSHTDVERRTNRADAGRDGRHCQELNRGLSITFEPGGKQARWENYFPIGMGRLIS